MKLLLLNFALPLTVATVEFKLWAGSPASHAAQVALDAGLSPPRRVFRPAGKHERKHELAGLDMWYEAELAFASASRQSVKAAEEHAVAKMRVGPRGSTQSMHKMALADTRVSVASAGVVPDPKLSQTTPPSSSRPDDPSYSTQGHYPSIGMEAAWALTTGNSTVVVAVVDVRAQQPPPLACTPSQGALIPSEDLLTCTCRRPHSVRGPADMYMQAPSFR